ncbi:VOC family protein [Enterococcus faecalis]
MTYQLPAATIVEEVTLQVADIDKMVAFYTKIIGLKTLTKTTVSATLAAQGTDVSIVRLEKTNNESSSSQATTGLYHTAFLLPFRKDLANMLVWFIKNKVDLGGADHGYSEALYLRDPEGNGIEIYWDRPLETWTIRPNGEIIGVTEELAVEDLLQAADGKWLGLVPGSKIGHVHLQVADLKATQGFYQRLGFTRTSNFGSQAKFFAAGSYHHHLGINTWNGAFLPKRKKSALGLVSYRFRLPDKRAYQQLKQLVQEEKLVFSKEENHLVIEDPNGMFIIFSYKPNK